MDQAALSRMDGEGSGTNSELGTFSGCLILVHLILRSSADNRRRLRHVVRLKQFEELSQSTRESSMYASARADAQGRSAINLSEARAIQTLTEIEWEALAQAVWEEAGQYVQW